MHVIDYSALIANQKKMTRVRLLDCRETIQKCLLLGLSSGEISMILYRFHGIDVAPGSIRGFLKSRTWMLINARGQND